MPDVVYRRAVVLTMAGRPDAGAQALDEAVQLGYSAKAARTDEDLTALHGRSDFKRLVGEPPPLAAKAEAK